MRKKYKKENMFIKRIFRKGLINNNVFSNYPIELKKKVYSNQVSLYDLKNYRKWYMDSDIVLDEFQLYCDSIDFKNFPSKVRNFFQLHRHFGVNNIYVMSQDPSRIVKQVRVLLCEYYEIVKFVKIPFLGIGFFRYNIYFNDEDYGKPVNVKKDEVTYKFKKRISLPLRYKKLYKSYNTKYMRCLVDNEPYFERIPFKEKYMSIDEVEKTFHFREKEELEKLEEERKMRRLKSNSTTRGKAQLAASEREKESDKSDVKSAESTELALDTLNLSFK